MLPKTECQFKVYEDGDELRIQNWHHDSPLGKEVYYLWPAQSCVICGDIIPTDGEVKRNGEICCAYCASELDEEEDGIPDN